MMTVANLSLTRCQAFRTARILTIPLFSAKSSQGEQIYVILIIIDKQSSLFELF